MINIFTSMELPDFKFQTGGHSKEVTSIVWAMTNTREIYSGSADGCIVNWNAENGIQKRFDLFKK